MAHPQMQPESETSSNAFAGESDHCPIKELGKDDESEVLDFFAARPTHTVFMASLVRDNGLVSPHNRGSFYAYRNAWGELEGVALLGHATVIEARSEGSISSFAALARNRQNAHLIRGEREMIKSFWMQFSSSAAEPRRICRELLLELRQSAPAPEDVDLRPANSDDLEKVLPVNAAMAFEEAGISPLQTDPGGFQHRIARRIEQGRVWVWIQNNKLIFKADVIGETPDVAYLEGVHVHAEERRKGYGLRCLRHLSSTLLTRSRSICLTVNQQNQSAMTFYTKAGYQFHSHYETIYLR